LHRSVAREARGHVVHRRTERRIPDGHRPALNEHLFARRPLELLVEKLVGAARAARAALGVRELLRPDRAAERDGRDHEDDPADHGGLPVAGAPPAPSGRLGLGGYSGPPFCWAYLTG